MASLTDKFNKISNLTFSSDVKMIHINELHDSKENFFEMSEIEELAEAILTQNGIQDNLIVTPLESGGYEIVSGHRRKAALELLIERGEDVPSKLPCRVRNYSSDDEKNYNLIMMNLSQRELSEADKYTSCIKLNEILKNEKIKGEKLGRIRDKIAETLHISTGQVNKINSIEKHAIPEVKDAIQEQNISINFADKIAHLPEEEQKKYAENNFAGISEKELDAKVEKYNPKKSKSKSVKVDTKNVETKTAAKGGTDEAVTINNNQKSLLEFISVNKAKLTETIKDLIDCLDEGSYEQDIIIQLVDEISKF